MHAGKAARQAAAEQPTLQPRQIAVISLPNVRQAEKIAAYVPGAGPNPRSRTDYLQRAGIIPVLEGDLNRWPWNPLAHKGPFYAGFDPLRALRVLVRHRRLDVVVSVFESNAFFILLLAPLFRFKPRMVMWEISARGWRIRDWVVDYVARRVEAIFVLTTHQESMARARYGSGPGPGPKVYRVGFAIDEAFFAPPPVRTASDFHVLAVGDDVGRDYATLFTACVAARQPLKIRSEAALPESPEVQGVITRIGRVSYPALRELYAAASVVVVPLHQTDHPSGITAVFEAMAMGCALIATDCPTTRDFVQHGKTGWLVKGNDSHALQAAIEHLRADAELRQRLGQAARQAIETRFSTAAYAHRFAECLQAVAHASSETGR